jgi:thiamine kinase-like enzyme
MDADVQAVLPLIPAFAGREVVVKQLGGGLTNRNYRLDVGDELYVLRIAGADSHLLGIDRAREIAAARTAAAAGVGPEVIAYLPDQNVLVTRFLRGRPITVEDVRVPAMMRRVAQALRRYHDFPMPADLARFCPFTAIRGYHGEARKRSVSMPDEVERACSQLASIEQEASTGEPRCLCHNDLLLGNFIDDGTNPRVIDWEYAGQGDRFFDLGNFAAHNQLSAADETLLLECYFDTCRPEHLRRLRLMRLASDLRESTWGYLQATISRLYNPQYYLDYGRKFLERFQAAPAAREFSG